MVTMHLEIITAEGRVYSDDVEILVAPGIDGELGILPHHAPLSDSPSARGDHGAQRGRGDLPRGQRWLS